MHSSFDTNIWTNRSEATSPPLKTLVIRLTLLACAAGSLLWYSTAQKEAGKNNPAVALAQQTVNAAPKLLEEPATLETPDQAITPAAEKPLVSIDDEGAVEIHVNDASMVEVLRMLSLQSQKNILCSKDVRGTVTANLYNVTIREALDQILHMNGYAYREKGNFINVYTIKELQQIEDAEKKVQTQVFRLFYTPAANAINMVKPVLSTAGQVSATTPAVAGIAAGGSDVGGNSHAIEDMLVITDFPENLERAGKVLKDIDRRPQQVLVEATILRAALSEDNALGVDFNVLAGVKFTDFTNSSGQINGASVKTTGVSGNQGSIGTGNSFSSSVPGGLKVGFVSDNVSIFLAALEGVTDTVVLANPKILALNKQKGEVIVGRKDGYLTTTVTQSSTVQTVEFLDTGTRLIFRPYIADDGFVRMELHPEDSSGGLTGANLPFKITTEMTSNIMVKDGHTIVIGGLFRESSDIAKSQAPLLGNIPFAGALFRNQRDRTTREEIIIMLTPHVIKDDDAYAKLSSEEMNKAEKLRVGVRRGMMPWGRERLAEGEFDKAMTEMNKPTPNNQKVLWHLDCAINLNPKFLEAIELKQKITGKEVSSVDNAASRYFVRDLMLRDRAPASPAPSGTKAGEENAPAKPSNPTANKDQPSDPIAEIDYEAYPLETLPPDSDQIISDTKAATSQPVLVKATPATQPTITAKKDDAPKSDPKSDTKPAKSSVPTFTVTELPVEEVKPDAPSTDENK